MQSTVDPRLLVTYELDFITSHSHRLPGTISRLRFCHLDKFWVAGRNLAQSLVKRGKNCVPHADIGGVARFPLRVAARRPAAAEPRSLPGGVRYRRRLYVVAPKAETTRNKVAVARQPTKTKYDVAPSGQNNLGGGTHCRVSVCGSRWVSAVRH